MLTTDEMGNRGKPTEPHTFVFHEHSVVSNPGPRLADLCVFFVYCNWATSWWQAVRIVAANSKYAVITVWSKIVLSTADAVTPKTKQVI